MTGVGTTVARPEGFGSGGGAGISSADGFSVPAAVGVELGSAVIVAAKPTGAGEVVLNDVIIAKVLPDSDTAQCDDSCEWALDGVGDDGSSTGRYWWDDDYRGFYGEGDDDYGVSLAGQPSLDRQWSVAHIPAELNRHRGVDIDLLFNSSVDGFSGCFSPTVLETILADPNVAVRHTCEDPAWHRGLTLDHFASAHCGECTRGGQTQSSHGFTNDILANDRADG